MRLIAPTGSVVKLSVATPPFKATGAAFNWTDPLKKFTVPVGVPLVVEDTVAMRVALAPRTGVVLLAVKVVTVGAWAIVMEPDPVPSVTV